MKQVKKLSIILLLGILSFSCFFGLSFALIPYEFWSLLKSDVNNCIKYFHYAVESITIPAISILGWIVCRSKFPIIFGLLFFMVGVWNWIKFSFFPGLHIQVQFIEALIVDSLYIIICFLWLRENLYITYPIKVVVSILYFIVLIISVISFFDYDFYIDWALPRYSELFFNIGMCLMFYSIYKLSNLDIKTDANEKKQITLQK